MSFTPAITYATDADALEARRSVGLAGLAGVAATGVLPAGQRRAQRHYQPDELRDRLHRRLAEVFARNGRLQRLGWPSSAWGG